MITILNRPYDGMTIKANAVYNGLPFVVDSDKRLAANFKYIAEIFTPTGKIGELRHNPDITGNNVGVFDIGRIVENYLSYDFKYDLKPGSGTFDTDKSVINYWIEFGEEYSRVGNITAMSSYTGGLISNKVRVTTEAPHNLGAGDRVLIGGATPISLNTWSKIVKLSNNSFVLTDINWAGPVNVKNAYYISGEEVTAFGQYTGSDGSNYVSMTVKLNTTFNVGDIIQFRQDRVDTTGSAVSVINTNYENVEWTIISKTTGSTNTVIRTNIPFGLSIPTNIYGAIVSKNNYLIRNLFSTKNDSAWAFNGVWQLDDAYLKQITPYVFTSANNNSNFITENPTNTHSMCADEYFTLSFFGRNIIKMIDPSQLSNWRVRIQTYSTPFNTNTFTPVSTQPDSSVQPSRLRMNLSGDQRFSFTEGSEVLITHSGGSFTATILRVFFSVTTSVILSTSYIILNSPTIKVTTQIKRYDRAISANGGMVGVGPANLAGLYEIDSQKVIKWEVYAIKFTTNSWTSNIHSMIWTFTMKSDCCKDKMQLMWLGQLGSPEFFTFDGRVDKLRNIEKQNWRRSLRSYDASLGFSYTNSDRGLTTYNTKSNTEYVVRSRYLTGEELDWLNYIYETPEVFMIQNINASKSKLFPITVIETQVEVVNKKNVGPTGRLYYMTIRFRLSNDRVIQRG